jgi:hypothetical protein
MLKPKDKARIKMIKTIYELFDELLCVDENQKSYVDETSDLLRYTSNRNCNHLIKYLKGCIADRRKNDRIQS